MREQIPNKLNYYKMILFSHTNSLFARNQRWKTLPIPAKNTKLPLKNPIKLFSHPIHKHTLKIIKNSSKQHHIQLILDIYIVEFKYSLNGFNKKFCTLQLLPTETLHRLFVNFSQNTQQLLVTRIYREKKALHSILLGKVSFIAYNICRSQFFHIQQIVAELQVTFKSHPSNDKNNADNHHLLNQL
eukprot:TRINITY_DN1026_c0_g1_i1.p1 TRINITY_DN1026_c0_g1~~TRINITY_DN1026_c0_g1_i1.p1  ORF type:complete len:186 (+),score=-6.68 TRINITY_DN1026_c0_g1_i1:591-1148(+)